MEVPHHWRLKRQRYALAGTACTHCGAPTLASKAVCPQCGSGKIQTEAAGMVANTYGYSVLQQPEMERVPVTRNR